PGGPGTAASPVVITVAGAPVPSEERIMSKSSLRGWLPSLTRRRTAPRRRPRARLGLDRLEARDVPSSSIPLNGFTWTPIGPSPIADGQSPGNPTSTGRLNGVAFDPVILPGQAYPFPNDPNTLY